MRNILWLLCWIHLGVLAQSLPAERIFLSLEKESCVPEDSLLVHGQLVTSDSHTWKPYSRYIYIECIDDRDSLLLRQKVSCDEKGYFCTEIPTQLEWRSNLCYLRAYTRLMQNYEPESFTVLPFLLGAVHPSPAKVAREVFAQCFPEGGSLLEGFQQNMVFRLSDEDGFPIVPTQVRLLDTDNDTIIHRITVSENGLGRCAFLPESGKHYRLQAEYDGRFFHFPLETMTTGATLQAILNRHRLTCRIFSSEERALHLFLYHAETGLTEIPLQDGQSVAVLDLSGQPSGVYTLFLTDDDTHLLSERILWLPQSEQPAGITCQLSQTAFAPSEPLNYRLQAPDSSRVFTRIVPQYDLIAAQACPALLFGNEIVSPVRFPLMESQQWTTQLTEINNWLFTARFSLFPIEKMGKGEMQYPYMTEDVMLLSGRAWKDKTHPLEAGTVINVQNRKEQLHYSGITDEKGYFILPVDDYTEGTPFQLSAQNRKGQPVDCTFTLQEECYPEVRIPYPLFRETPLQTMVVSDSSSFRYSVDEDQNKVYHIDNVTVQARKPVNFREASRTPLNYIGEIELQKRASLSLRSILNMFPSIVVQKSGSGGGTGILGAINKSNESSWSRSQVDPSPESGELGIFWRNNRTPMISGINANKLTVVVDREIAFGDIGYILDQPAGNIKSIEILRPYDTRCVPYNATEGALLIETLHGLVRPTSEQGKTTVRPLGLSASSREPVIERNAPNQPGHYLLLIDVITKEKQVISFCKPFEVK